MRRIFLPCILLYFSVAAAAQQRSVSEDYGFVEYLLGNSLESDASTLLNQTDYLPSDTLDFLKGWTAYSRKNLDEAVRHFNAVTSESVFFDKAAFFGAVCNAHLGRYDAAGSVLESWSFHRPDATQTLRDCYCLERSGISLLNGNPDEYRLFAAGFSGETAFLNENFNALESICNDMFREPQRKPWVAGLASAIIPGAGQFYAGDKAKGILTFLLEGAAAAIVIEQYNHYGIRDWRTMTWAGLGFALHVINICGATVSVSVRNENLADKRSTAVLYNIHIPLRTVLR